MPKVTRCCICGRLCGEIPRPAKPYKSGYACDECYVKNVVPAIKLEEERKRRRYGQWVTTIR